MDFKIKIKILMLLSFSIPVFGQGTSKAVIDSLSVNIETGHIYIGWHPLEVDTVYYLCMGDYDQNPSRPPCFIDEILLDYTDTLYVDTNVNANVNNKFVLYRISGSEKIYSSYHKTIFLQSELDSCHSSIRLFWNAYEGWEGEIEYKIYNYDNGNLIASTNETQYVVSDINNDKVYSFFIRAHSINRATSSSNITSYNTSELGLPEYINAGTVTAGENNLELSFNIDPDSKITKYILYRSTDKEMIVKDQIEVFENHTQNEIYYTDPDFNPDQVYYYQLEAIDSCDFPVFFSDTLKNIVLDLNYINDIVELQWSDGNIWPDQTINYEVYRNSYENDQILITVVTANRYNDVISNIAGHGNKNEICYTVKAINNSSGYINSSYQKCIEVVPEIFTPESFSPDGDGVNDYFIPEFDFIPSGYELIIIDRTGKVVFESHNPEEEWTAETIPQGTYIYKIIYNKPGKGKQVKTGYVNLVRKNNLR